MLVFAIAILAHCPQFTDPKNVDQLLTMKSCLWFIMEPLITKNDSYCYSFYKGMLDRLKTVKDALEPDNEVVNEVNLINFCYLLFLLHFIVIIVLFYFHYRKFMPCVISL